MQTHLFRSFQVAAVIALFTPQAYGNDYTVHIVEPPINNHMILPDGSLPPVCTQADSIRLSACRGEYEPASFVVSAADQPLQDVRIAVSPVDGPGLPWPDDAIDVRVVNDIARGMPTSLVHDDHVLDVLLDETKTAEQLNALDFRDADELLPVTIAKRKQFWVTVHVPDNAEAGTYQTTLSVVPGEGNATELSLVLEVYPFELLPPMIEYSIYYPVYLDRAASSDTYNFSYINEEQYLAEIKNMLAHGLSNPNIYQGPTAHPDGSLEFSVVNRILDIRESVGMRPKALYLVGHPVPMQTSPLRPEQRERTRRYVHQINAWAKRRGYDEVFFMGGDEWWGEELSAAHESYQAIHDAGGKSFVAVMHTGFFDRVGDVLDRPVLQSTVSARVNAAFVEYRDKYGEKEAARLTSEMVGAVGFEEMIERPEFRKAIDGYHRLGRKIYTYMNPMAGLPYPELQRRCEGLGLWRVGFDGTTTWAYTHISSGDKINQPMHFAKVHRTDGGVIDTTYWEGHREGIDDVRYLTTLYDVLNGAAGRFPGAPLITETHAWLAGLDVVNGDLDAIRQEIARKILALQDMGYRQLSDAEALADVDMERVQVVTFPEPWQFKLDTDDEGVALQLFSVELDDSAWAQVRTDIERGWEKQGFAGKQSVGYGWYRARLPLAEKDLTREFRYLYFEAVDEDAWVYINGEEVFEHSVTTTGLLPERIWLTPFHISLAEADLRGNDLLTVRVHNSGGMGGIWKPVHLILSDQSLTDVQLRYLVKTDKE